MSKNWCSENNRWSLKTLCFTCAWVVTGATVGEETTWGVRYRTSDCTRRPTLQLVSAPFPFFLCFQKYVGSKPWRHTLSGAEQMIDTLVFWRLGRRNLDLDYESKNAVSFRCNLLLIWILNLRSEVGVRPGYLTESADIIRVKLEKFASVSFLLLIVQ